MLHQQWKSPGKLNLFLYVTGYRSDGYHLLQTLFQFIDYGDTMEIFPTNNRRIRLFTVENYILKNNLIIKAAKLLRYYCCMDKKKIGADIILNKKLPIESGLGGFSSNAATVLMILNQQWKCYLHKNILMRLGLMLGADVPIFIHGYSSFAEGIGEKLISVCLPEQWYLIVMPTTISINTTYVFNEYRASYSHYSVNRSIRKLLNQSFSNDLEPIVRKKFPEIKIYFEYLSQYTKPYLTGTGSCIFAKFPHKYEAYRVQSHLPSWIKSIVVQGVNISPLHLKLSKHFF